MKKLIIICAFGSITFLIVQIYIMLYSEYNSAKNNEKVFNINFLFNVKLMQEILKKFQVISVLIDKDILSIPISKFKIQNKIDVYNCNHFCSKFSTVFLISGIKIERKFAEIKTSWEKHGFHVDINEDFDMAHESLEHFKDAKKQIYHIFLTRNSTLLHLVVSYPRFKGHWSKKCTMKKSSTIALFSQQSHLFCLSDYIFKFPYPRTVLLDGVSVNVPQFLKIFLQEFQTHIFIPCNFAQARLFYSLYGYENDEESEIFRSKAKHILEIVSIELSKYNIPFWLSSGTLLGWFRQCDFITHSKDVDIGIWIKYYNESFVSSFLERGFHLKHRFGKVEDSFELSFEMENIKLDIFFFYEDSNYMWNGGTQVKSRKKFKYIFHKFSLCWSELSNILVRVPCEPTKYIQANYGNEWRIPIKTWDWKSSPPNVRENGEWPMEEQVIYMN
ncbi:ribitol-5-phosphate transferase FKTN [Hydra vulgaris]|uniref:Ribitol-5-phosphate transferase FKTN n=1 Tax=Hydra vulgaris TaxID=6087 RepID=A0ABM4CQU2_HYDVU